MSAEAVPDPLARLVALAEIQNLKAEYAAAADAKYTPDRQPCAPDAFAAAAARQAACFAEDAVWHGGERFGGDIVGRPAIEAFFRRSPWRWATHLYAAPALRVEGDTAHGTWRLWQLGIAMPEDRVVLLIGTCTETYRRTAEGWRVASSRFDTLHSLPLGTDAAALRCLIPLKEAL